jgi:ribosome silencing factor RsfS/YbeB/iojap
MTDTRKTPPRKTATRKSAPRKTAAKTAPKTAAKPAPKRVAAKALPKAPAKAPTSSVQQHRVLGVVLGALDDMKAVDVRTIDVRGHSDVTDFMVIASGNSDRHVRSIADRVVQLAKAGGVRPFGVEGAQEGEWVLVDLPDVMVHVMLPRSREFYQLEQLWEPVAAKPASIAPAGSAANGRPRRRRPAAPAR